MIPSGAGEQATGMPGERLAPVTYLFGAQPADAAPASEGQAPLSANHPVFRDEAAVSAVGGEPREQGESRERRQPPERGEQSRERGRFDQISNVSMYALARRGMSSREMRDYLLGREFEEPVVDEEVRRLEGVGLLDDDSLAETLVRTLRDRKGLGRSGLTAELRRRHVDAEAIEEAMGSLDDDELDRATAIATKRAPQLRSLDMATAKRRLGAFLMRKGYSGSVISAAVQRALEPSGPTFR